MNGILAKSTEDRTNNIRSSKPAESIETAGSLASNQFHSLLKQILTMNFQQAIHLQWIILNTLMQVKLLHIPEVF